MPNYMEEKNVLIVPLSFFIRFNKKKSGEQFANLFANLFGNFFKDTLMCDEEKQEHEKLCDDPLEKILTSQIVADFNLGKKNKHEFISELVNFFKLPSNKANDIEAAWNSLIALDPESNEAFNALIKLTLQGKSIYFIGNTNELHAKKILDLFAGNSPKQISFLENLPEEVQASPLAVSQASCSELADEDLAAQMGTIYFGLSYAYKTLLEQPQNFLTTLFTSFKPTSGLLTHLKASLNDIGKTQEDILLINPYKKNHAIIKKLALDTISKETFYTDLLELSVGTTATATVDLKLEEVHFALTNVTAHENAATLQAAEHSASFSASPQTR